LSRHNHSRWRDTAKRTYFALFLSATLLAAAQSPTPQILSILPAHGPEGTRVAINGQNLIAVSTAFFAGTPATFRSVSPENLIVIVPHKVSTSSIVVVTKFGRITSPRPFVIANDPRIPDEVSYKAGYVNPISAQPNFTSVRLWGIAIADTRVPHHESAEVKVASTLLTCRIDGKDVILNDDAGDVHGGLYQRQPWFATDAHTPLPLAFDPTDHSVILTVGRQPDRVWHFWSPSPRSTLAHGKLEGCTVQARVKISAGALLQMGMDYWRSATVPYGAGGNNHEAGASDWYFPSPQWQEATFTDVGGVQF
jgi:hypothetical protein